MTPLGIAAENPHDTDPTCLGTKPWIVKIQRKTRVATPYWASKKPRVMAAMDYLPSGKLTVGPWQLLGLEDEFQLTNGDFQGRTVYLPEGTSIY